MNSPAARFSRFAKHWQISSVFAKVWQNGWKKKALPREAEEAQSNGPNGPLPMFGKMPRFLPNIGKMCFPRRMRRVLLFSLFSFLFSLSAAAAEPPPAAEPAPPPEAVCAPRFLDELALHLYRWYLDESDLDPDRIESDGFRFLVRRLDRAADEGDKSEWAEIRLPQMNLGVTLKRPDYRIEELDLAIQSDLFRIVNIFRLDAAEPEPDGGWTVIDLPLDAMMERLLGSLNAATFPSPGLTDRLRRACRRAMDLDPDSREAGDQVMHIAPMSAVANEVWVFIGNENLLMRFSADDDLEDEGLWPFQELDVKVFDVFRQTIVTHDQVPGSNMYMTLDQVGRALFNCIVLGKRLIVINPDDPDAAPIHRMHVHKHEL
jgi:hypothetical protein